MPHTEKSPVKRRVKRRATTKKSTTNGGRVPGTQDKMRTNPKIKGKGRKKGDKTRSI